jgi:hypothetical protein
MAKKTNVFSVTSSAWTEISSGLANVFVQASKVAPVRIAVAEASGDLSTSDGHIIERNREGGIPFSNLGATHKVFARAFGVDSEVTVTAY